MRWPTAAAYAQRWWVLGRWAWSGKALLMLPIPPSCVSAQPPTPGSSSSCTGRPLQTAENSHQMLLVNDPTASAAAMAWLRQLMGGKKGGGSDSGGGGSGGGSGSNGADAGTPRSKL